MASVLRPQSDLLGRNSKPNSKTVQRKDISPFSGTKALLSKVPAREFFSNEADGLEAKVPAGRRADLESSLKLLGARKELSMVLVS